MSYVVAGRTREIGLRMALGAQAADVLRLILRQGMLLAAIGAIIGLVIGLGRNAVVENLALRRERSRPDDLRGGHAAPRIGHAPGLLVACASCDAGRPDDRAQNRIAALLQKFGDHKTGVSPRPRCRNEPARMPEQPASSPTPQRRSASNGMICGKVS